MSSIAYVSDESMLEYHRLRGSTSMNFWRLSSRNQFTRFYPGELLFFFVKIPGRTHKGFIGYGHFEESVTMSFDKTWSTFKEKNGFDSKEEFKQAIYKLSRNHELPKKMNSLVLRDPVFFNSVIFPEDVNIKISDNLESYTYLDDEEDPFVSLRLLEFVDRVGLDPWSELNKTRSEDVLFMDRLNITLSHIARTQFSDHLDRNEENRCRRLKNRQIKKGNKEILFTNDTYSYTDRTLLITIPFAPTEKNYSVRYRMLIGRMMIYAMYLQESKLNLKTIRFAIVTHKKDYRKQLDQITEVMNKNEE